MLYSEVKKMHPVYKVACGLLLVLLFHSLEVHGTFYSHGLTRNGQNVCERHRSKSVSRTVVVTTTNHERYYTKCGFLGWNRCKRSRTVTGYKNRWAYHTEYDTELFCCTGWRKSGSTCPTAICSSPCKNGGRCTSPDTCSCPDGWTASDCSEAMPCMPPEVTNKHAQVLGDMKNLYQSRETVVFGCEPGYRVVGNGTRECNKGNWTTTDFSCEKTCYQPWTQLKKRCYLVIESPSRRWKDTSTKCLNLSSHMVKITSEEENQFTGQLAKVYLEEKKMGQVQMWLGLRKLHSEGQFQWVDGSPLEGYTNWAPDKPNNDNGRELCSEMLVSTKYWVNTWNDVECDGSVYRSITVCEKPLREGD